MPENTYPEECKERFKAWLLNNRSFSQSQIRQTIQRLYFLPRFTGVYFNFTPLSQAKLRNIQSKIMTSPRLRQEPSSETIAINNALQLFDKFCFEEKVRPLEDNKESGELSSSVEITSINHEQQTKSSSYLENVLQEIEWNDLITAYKPKNYAPISVAEKFSTSTCIATAVPIKLKINQDIIEKLINLLSEHFSNGYLLSSPIEMIRLRSFASEKLGLEIKLSDEELKLHIAACGTNHAGKIYIVSTEAKKRVKKLAEEYFATGAKVIFFDEFFTKNEDWMFDEKIVSKEMLTDILRNFFPRLSFTLAYFGYINTSISSALESEILRVWGSDALQTYDQLAERLPYIPRERIKQALGQNKKFIWSSTETFSHISRIEITDKEREAIRTSAQHKCNARGYVPIKDLPVGNIEERNYELSTTAIYNATYLICLSDKFDRRDKIITRKGDVIDALTIIKEYCQTVDKCSLEDLLNYEKELTGKINRSIPMEAANSVLVRIDKEKYVSNGYVHFDVNMIDEAIELIVNGNYVPLKSITTFGAFPDCGQNWNLFLLESYCRRFSKKFRFDAPWVNSRNAGAIIRKSCAMDYTEIMIDAVANSDTPLKLASVGNFLFEKGYIGKRTNAKAKEIIEKAKNIRERRN